MAAGGGTGNVGTEYEQLIAKVMELNGDPSKSFLRSCESLHRWLIVLDLCPSSSIVCRPSCVHIFFSNTTGSVYMYIYYKIWYVAPAGEGDKKI